MTTAFSSLADLLDPKASRWYCDRKECDGNPHGEWRWCEHADGDHDATCRHARSNQRPPADDRWNIWLLLAGRGFGKSRAGCEWIVDQALRYENSSWGVVAPTWNDVRKCADDPGMGLSFRLGSDLRSYNRTLGIMSLQNGATIHLASADKPDRLRGYNFWGCWADELAAWRYPETWTAALMPALRIGPHPRVVVTTTPKTVRLVRDLLDRTDGSVAVTRGSTWDNSLNLAGTALEELKIRYEGTRIGRQELYGELLLDTPGALWNLDTIDRTRAVLVGVDDRD